MRVALAVEYDGAHFCGWQSQTDLCGVQDSVENAIARIAEHTIRIHAAGRISQFGFANHKNAHHRIPRPKQHAFTKLPLAK